MKRRNLLILSSMAFILLNAAVLKASDDLIGSELNTKKITALEEESNLVNCWSSTVYQKGSTVFLCYTCKYKDDATGHLWRDGSCTTPDSVGK